MEHQNNPVYFAAKKAEDTASVLLNKADSFFNLLRANAYLEKLANMWRAYAGAYNTDVGMGHQVNFTGEQGELVALPVNHFRNIAQHIYVMITANRPIMEARAINTDYKSLSQAYLANGILDYYMREKGLEECLKTAAEMAIILGSGFIKMEWDATAGDEFNYDEESGQMSYEGEIKFTNLSPWDVVFDGTKETWSHDWIMVRTFKNRFDLMAKYPELADKISKLPTKSASQIYRLAVWSNDDTDDIPVFEFFHKKTESMPDGRYLLFLSSDIILLDMGMPYRTLPVFRMSPGNILGTPYGYTPMFDVYPIQECINSLYSIIMTNNNAFGVQNLFVKRGSDLTMASLDGAMNIVEGLEPPSPIQLTATSPETYKFLETLIHSAETISGVNSVARGNPDPNLKSGTALALVQSMALQFISGLQQSYVKLIEDVGTALIQNLKDFAQAPKVIAIVGKNNRPYLKEFTGEDIKDVNRVVVDIGNPLSRTIAGRVAMAEQLAQMKLLDNPQQYFQVMATGKLEVTFEGDMSELLLVKSENEKMLEGKAPIVSPLDQHSMHITEHKAILSDPDAREKPELVKIAMDHIEQHFQALQNTDPRLLQLIGQNPVPPMGVPMPPGAPPGEPPPEGPGPSGGGSQAESVAEQVGGPMPAAHLPKPAKPPKPFNNLPVDASQMIPK